MSETLYHIGVEDIEPDHWVAYVFELFGCYSSAQTQSDALSSVSNSIDTYSYVWLWRGHPHDMYNYYSPPLIQIAEISHSHPAVEDPDYLVNAFFHDDTRPLTLNDIQEVQRIMNFTREDLLETSKSLSPAQLHQPIPTDTRFGSIAAILKHVAATEWWYCDRLGLVENRNILPKDPLKALEISRANTYFRLPELIGDTRIVEKVDERWSARKLVRRALWHERDHTEHIRKLIPIL